MDKEKTEEQVYRQVLRLDDKRIIGKGNRIVEKGIKITGTDGRRNKFAVDAFFGGIKKQIDRLAKERQEEE